MSIAQEVAEARMLRNKVKYPTPFPRMTWWQKVRRWFKK